MELNISSGKVIFINTIILAVGVSKFALLKRICSFPLPKGGNREDEPRLFLEVDSKSWIGNRHKVQQEKLLLEIIHNESGQTE